MEITAQPASASLPSQNSTESEVKNKAVISSDFETFLKMLTAQMQNQDPLNPIESADFAVQLATFSTVEQQVKTNSLLTELGSQIGILGMAQLSGWVGMQARAVMPVYFDGAPVSLTTQGSPFADSAQLVVRGPDGSVVHKRPVGIARQDIVWAGVGKNGAPVPNGTYEISVESTLNGEVVDTRSVEVHARIAEARNENGLPVLVMESGQELSASQVLGLRRPGA